MEILAFPLFVGGFCALWMFVLSFMARIGGWSSLAAVYGVDGRPQGMDMRHMCSMRIGRKGAFPTRYNGTMSFGVNGDGIYIRPFFPFSISHQGVFLPFLETQGEAAQTLGWSGAFDITTERVPDIKLRVSSDLGDWIERTAMADRNRPA